ncbi:MAG: cupredoxin domain-containing protein [Ardenticatenaceae bacterium]|nr:cupredoxin domain-containing protein [Ardenticatenaceae bacterium]HBY96256.1 cupredoxin domain-containing protein [Chloroflexota bacterium]
MPFARARSEGRVESHFRLRLAVFLVVTLLVVATAAWLLRPQTLPAGASRTVSITMAGFDPSTLTIPAAQPVTVRLVNPDTQFHTDGGGVHQFAVPELGLDVKVQPKSSALVTIPAVAPGSYTFYCDVCCGGKENPTMQGTLVVS